MAESTLNQVMLMGRIFGEVGTHYTPASGKQVAKFTLEVATSTWSEDSDLYGDSTLIPCVLFNSPSLTAAMIDGMRVLVVGFLNAKVHKNDQTVMNVVVRHVEFLDNKARSAPKKIRARIIGEEKWRK